MTAIEELIQAVMVAPAERRAEALRVLRGEPAPQSGNPSGSDAYLTLNELAERLGFSTCTLWRWRVPGHALGGRRRFRLSEVSAYLESDDFKRRAAALRAERKPSAKGTRPEARNSKP